MKPKSNQADGADGSGALSDPAGSSILHMEPQVGGSFVRDLNSGELKKIAGPANTEQPIQE